jgi:L-seryl-tRNA(Ser) seleniumtransferase
MRNMQMDDQQRELLRQLPKIDEIILLLEHHKVFERAPREIVVNTCRSTVGEMREAILRNKKGGEGFVPPSLEQVAAAVARKVESLHRPSLRRVVNATGILLHTNLGRAPLCEEALDHVIDVSRGYSNLEYDLEKGKRGLRYDHVARILCDLTGAEDALVVNNNAAAVLLVLNALAAGREAVVSRGELIEIGGEFRIPEVMEKSGAILREVGTTNRTHLTDYEKAIGEKTGLLLKVHTSNFMIMGFTEEVQLPDLVALGRKRGIPVMSDLGSGCFIDTERFGLKKEPTVQETLKTGVDVVTFSGDKLMGGPQAGIILGRRAILEQIKKNPLNRALRIDKMTLAALEATLRLYLREGEALARIRGLRVLTEPVEEVARRAKKLLRLLKKSKIEGLTLSLKKGSSMAGGGSLPTQEIPSVLLSLRSLRLSANAVEERLRQFDTPIIARIADEGVLFDLRTIDTEEFDIIRRALEGLARP